MSSLYRKSTPARSACAPGLVRQVVDDLVHLVHARRSGCPTACRTTATPAMLTAGPIGSVGGAFRSLYANCARVSLTVRGDSVSVLLTAIV